MMIDVSVNYSSSLEIALIKIDSGILWWDYTVSIQSANLVSFYSIATLN
jgi:hypothetical protein